MVAQGNGASRTGHVTLLSPAVLLKNALGFTLVAGRSRRRSRARGSALGVVAVGAVALAVWTFLRAQGVETWEATRGQRWTLGLAIARLMLLPVVIADTNYDTPAPRRTNAPAVRGVFGARRPRASPSSNRRVRLPRYCCMAVLNRDDGRRFRPTRRRDRDLLVLLPVDVDPDGPRPARRRLGRGRPRRRRSIPNAQPSPDALETRDVSERFRSAGAGRPAHRDAVGSRVCRSC